MPIFFSIESFVLLIVSLYLLYRYLVANYDYWKRKGVPYVKPTLLFGNYFDILMFRKTIADKLKEMYNDISGPYFGMWVFRTPYFIIKSPELIKSVLIKDFKYFEDRSITCNKHADEMASCLLFVSKNPDWKIIRTKMTPAFTSGKIKSLMPAINKVGEELTAYLRNLCSKCDNLEAKEISAKYATDVITSCAFGVEANSFKEDGGAWRSVGRDMFAATFTNGFRSSSYFFLPFIVDLLKLKFVPPNVTDFLREAFWQTINRREGSSETRNDLIDIILKLKQEGDVDGLKFEGDKVVAQAVQFFIAGFETTSATIAYALYEIGINKSVQNRLAAEIESIIKQHGGIKYEAIQDMKYLHQVVQETLRKYPVLPFLDRTCAADYKIPGTDVTLEKGTSVYIPMFGLHYDAEYYKNPDVFDPDRFSVENINSIPSCAFLPFGSGPRNCLGERMGLISAKVALVHVLSQFEVIRTDKTPVPIEFDPKSFVLVSKVGLPMKFKERRLDID